MKTSQKLEQIEQAKQEKKVRGYVNNLEKCLDMAFEEALRRGNITSQGGTMELDYLRLEKKVPENYIYNNPQVAEQYFNKKGWQCTYEPKFCDSEILTQTYDHYFVLRPQSANVKEN